MDSPIFQLLAEVELRHWWFVARLRIMGHLLRQALPPDASRLVVDVGCGCGANIASLASDYECIGVDASEEAIDFARERFDGVHYICGQAPQILGDRAQDMDGLVMMDVLEHVKDDQALLDAQLDSLKPGGIALLTVPADMRLWSEHDVNLGHYRRYDPEMFRTLWKNRPIDELMLSHFNTRLYPVIRGVRLLSRMRGRAWGKAGTDMSVPPGPVNGLLRRIFEGESRRLCGHLEGRGRGYSHGVSLIAVLRKRTKGPSSG